MLHLFPEESETIAGVTAALRAGKLSCVDVVMRCLAQIDAWEGKIHAWVRVDRDGALSLAAQRDAELQAGKGTGALHGIPIGIKDIIDVAGWPTGCGSALLGKQPVARDAPLVAALREAGAIILGKTVTTQFACFDPPVTRNPWNTSRTPGGSSSGSAAGVATGMCLAAIGSQTGGSITRPATYCGVSGCKPTLGAINSDGVYPVAHSLDHPGPIARSVADLAVLLDVLAPGAGVVAHLAAATAKPPRLGRLRGLFDRVDAEMRSALERALQGFVAAGAAVTDAALPASFEEVPAQHRRIMARELYDLHARRVVEHPDDYLPRVRSLIDEGEQTSRVAYDAARRHQESLRRDIGGAFDGADVLISAATPGPAPNADTTGDPSMNAPWSYTGLPTVSFPIGLSRDGLPLGIQLVGRAGDERGLFRAAAWCEAHVVRPS